MTKWSAVTPDETLIDSTTEVIDLQNGDSNQRIRFSIPTLGLTVIPIHKLSDLPPVVNGFHQLKQDTVYNFVAEITSPDTLLIPAGWRGYIIGMHNSLTNFTYSGSSTAIKTLNIDGPISSIADAGSGAITVTTGVAHGLLDGQFVNITGTTSYNQQRLVISNASGSVFDVQIAFVADESGDFDTGYNAINIMNMAFFDITGLCGALDLTAATASSVFRYYNMKMSAFFSLGNIRNGKIIGYDGNFDFVGTGIDLIDIDKATVLVTTITKTVTSGLDHPLLTLSGSLTRDIVLDKIQFNSNNNNEFAIKINNTITNASISITNSPDNNVATDYFDSNGLDQTDPQVFTFNNGKRANSTTESESRSVGVLEVDGSGGSGVPVPIEDITPVSGDFELDIASAGFSMDTSTGVVTYEGIAPKTFLIGYSLEAAQTSGANQNLTFDLRINTIQQTKTTRTLITMGVGSFEPVANIGGFFIINPGDIIQLFKNNTNNANNTDVQNLVLLIR